MARKQRSAEQAKPDAEAAWPRTFTVTPKAGPKVANRRVRAGDTISLAELEAAHEIRIGAIVPADPIPETPDGSE
jgi:hypothetical protein